MYHAPVLLHASIEMLGIQADGIYADVTFGGGGHARAILEGLNSNGKLFAFDQDPDAEKNAQAPEFANNPSFTFIASNFRLLKRQLRSEGIEAGSVAGILADLGVSSFQLDTAERGFSYRFEGPLDMRMNNQDGPTAADVLNTYSAEALQNILSAYGELRNARSFAQACVELRQTNPFKHTEDLVALCTKLFIGDRMRYMSQVFQALRMEVNEEIGALKDFLSDALEMLAPGGRLVVLTYHSIEDRMVKNFMKTGNIQGQPEKDFYGNITRPFDLVLKKAGEATEAEVKGNSRARSARLRVAQKTKEKNGQ
ncbi:MAG: 16S rRNA (cytosine(1402)-N(4))-methyltransferase RsmH [Bacteroidetes bacterium]|nr:16S rRNA (cytosine(1402)-N(4))-methyltransferase RsmH [Bacteroidota bacterium]